MISHKQSRETVQHERKEKEDTTKELEARFKSNLDTIQQLHKQVCGLYYSFPIQQLHKQVYGLYYSFPIQQLHKQVCGLNYPLPIQQLHKQVCGLYYSFPIQQLHKQVCGLNYPFHSLDVFVIDSFILFVC